jgi:hypothetical protein
MGESQVMEQPLERLRLNATTCRELADTAITPAARDILADLAEQYEQKATTLEHANSKRRRRPAFNWSLP